MSGLRYRHCNNQFEAADTDIAKIAAFICCIVKIHHAFPVSRYDETVIRPDAAHPFADGLRDVQTKPGGAS